MPLRAARTHRARRERYSARDRSWIEFASATLASIATFYRAPDELTLLKAAASLRRRFERLDAELGTGPWFNGAAFSLVDAAFGPVFRYFEVIGRYGDFGFFDGLSPDGSTRRVQQVIAGRTR